jgi:16S rRNA (uracil1498-N3)-methyltransferase
MHRFFVPPNEWDLDALRLREGEAHHARDVLRMKRGDKLVVFNGHGHEVTAEIVDLARDQIALRELHDAKTPPLKCRITLGQAIPKGKNMDLIVQKAVEIGAAEIAPLISERTVVDLDEKEAEQKRAKWQQVAIEAAKQCGQNWLPRVHRPQTLKNFFASVEAGVSPARPQPTGVPPQFDLRLIGSLQPDARRFREVLADYRQQHGAGGGVLMLIGPEGDFTPAELGLAKSQGAVPITLGPIILRVETAAIYCLSVLSYELFS